ncbi:hypothetical protein GCM10023321_68090 [Pseudonocardia eucalypti]|uniref:STAS domain-containing protein n=1 Tax=Pseudonocardia eucalypti TaxID=648755 RepID=A0ABP9R1L7_9PSEU
MLRVTRRGRIGAIAIDSGITLPARADAGGALDEFDGDGVGLPCVWVWLRALRRARPLGEEPVLVLEIDLTGAAPAGLPLLGCGLPALLAQPG